MEGDRQLLQVVIQLRPHPFLDVRARARHQRSAQVDQPSLDHPEREHPERQHHQPGTISMRDRAVDDLLDEHRDAKSGQHRGQCGNARAE